MKLGDGVEWGLHCCVVLAALPPGVALPAARLAEFHGVPAAYLAKHLQSLANAGVLESVAGRRGGYRLARPAADITVLDVVQAVEGGAPAFRCTEIRRRGPAGLPAREYQAACSITAVMQEAEHAWREVLRRETIADLVGRVARTINPKSAVLAAEWFQEVVR